MLLLEINTKAIQKTIMKKLNTYLITNLKE